MRIGIYAGQINPLVGGSSSLKAMVLRALGDGAGEHEFLLVGAPVSTTGADMPLPLLRFDDRAAGRGLLAKLSGWSSSPLSGAAGAGPYCSPLDKLARDNCLDLFWFFAPFYQKTSLPYIYTLWDLEHRNKPYFPEVSITGWDWDAREAHYREVLPRATKIMTGTEAGKSEIVRFYGVAPENVAVIPFPSPVLPPENQAGIAVLTKYGLNTPFLFYPAQFWPHKNHVNILLALRILQDRGIPALDMVFAGSDQGNRRHVESKVRELGLADRVHILGYVPDEDLAELYRQAYALVFASFFGPDNLPPLEAFSLGCPVIAARTAGANEQLRDAALLFDPADAWALAAVIERLQKDQELRVEMVRRGYARPRFTARDYVTQVQAVIDGFEGIRRCWGTQYRQP